MKRAILKDVNPQSRLFLRLQLSSGGAPETRSNSWVRLERMVQLPTGDFEATLRSGLNKLNKH